MAVTDTFTGSDGTALPTYSANWSTLASSALNNMQIKTNGVQDVSSSGNVYSGRTWSNDQYSQAVLLVAATQRIAVAVRGDLTAQTYYGGGISPANEGNNKYIIYKFVAGVYTRLAQTAAQTLSVNDVVKLKVVGTSLTLTVNSTDILGPTTDSDIATGLPGFTGFDGTGVAILDTWEGDDIGGAIVPTAGAATLTGAAGRLGTGLTPGTMIAGT